MMDQLIMPLAHTSLQIHADQAVGEQVVARAMSAVKIRRWCFHRQVGQADLFVDGHLSPNAGVAVDSPGLLEPGLVPEFTRLRKGIELQKFPSDLNVKSQ